MVHSNLSLSQLLNQPSQFEKGHGGGFQADLSGVGARPAPPQESMAGGHGLPLAEARHQAEQEWLSGIAALVKLLLEQPRMPRPNPQPGLAPPPLGVVLSGPFPVLPDRLMGQPLSQWLLVPEPLERILAVARPLLPGQGQKQGQALACDLPMIPLAAEDPLARERFCLLLTAHFSLVLVLGETDQGQPLFQFSFDPEIVERAWHQLRDRIARSRPPLLPSIDQAVGQFPPVTPDYRLVTQYSHLLLQQLRPRSRGSTAPVAAPSPVQFAALELPSRPTLPGRDPAMAPPAADLNGGVEADLNAAWKVEASPTPGSDTELLKAMAHEIRTPLTTIRTLTRSLLRRKDLSEAVTQRLRAIDRECTQQIDRFNLIFRAVELETEAHKQPKSPLSAISLTQLFQEAIPLWQQQVSRRNLTLTVNLPPQLPMVNSDPTMLNQVLTGLIDRFTHSLPPYSHIDLSVTLAGHQLKLQFQSQPCAEAQGASDDAVDTLLSSPFKALGQLLIFQPETGGLSLNLQATKNLFQALGGKLIVRHRPQAGEVLTVFLPLETRTL
ncbi:MAG TPA: HAMP domain-containing histidine kinase [Leptolyngbyaceae cyanobacterium M65_K2018_010]|nr:HAMP domain-containing histidine kinase [Leptolyngbyaceae cyanobacterium M65_K2018_010]